MFPGETVTLTADLGEDLTNVQVLLRDPSNVEYSNTTTRIAEGVYEAGFTVPPWPFPSFSGLTLTEPIQGYGYQWAGWYFGQRGLSHNVRYRPPVTVFGTWTYRFRGLNDDSVYVWSEIDSFAVSQAFPERRPKGARETPIFTHLTLTIAELRDYLRINGTEDDVLLATLLDAAKAEADDYCNNDFGYPANDDGGYSGAIPANVKLWVMQRVARNYENRPNGLTASSLTGLGSVSWGPVDWTLLERLRLSPGL